MNGLAVLIGAGILSLWQSKQCTGAPLSHRICSSFVLTLHFGVVDAVQGRRVEVHWGGTGC